GNAGLFARDGRLVRRDDETRGEPFAAILARAGLAEIVGEGAGATDPAAQKQYAMHAHGAVFAEVKVDPELGMVRASRLVGAFAAGRIVNANFGEYYVPTNADVPAMQAILVEEHDRFVNALGIKGVGEIGVTG